MRSRVKQLINGRAVHQDEVVAGSPAHLADSWHYRYVAEGMERVDHQDHQDRQDQESLVVGKEGRACRLLDYQRLGSLLVVEMGMAFLDLRDQVRQVLPS